MRGPWIGGNVLHQVKHEEIGLHRTGSGHCWCRAVFKRSSPNPFLETLIIHRLPRA